MNELIFSEEDATQVRQQLTAEPFEACAVLYGNAVARQDGTLRILVREIQFPFSEDYSIRGPLEAELTPSFLAKVTKKAQLERSVLIFVHSHLGHEPPHFSGIDDSGEKHIAAFLDRRHPMQGHTALVVSSGGMRARFLGSNEQIRIVTVGHKRQVVSDPLATGSPDLIFDRQVRAFGSWGQEAIQQLRVGIVGLGGTGSLVAQQLVHLGVRRFILVDPDVIEVTNLNRVANATPADVGRSKVEVADRYIKTIAKESEVTGKVEDVTNYSTAQQLLNADIIFGCTDSHGSRAVLQQMAYQYLIPCIDMGTTITVLDSRITHIYGRVQLLAPGLACLMCSGLLDPNEVRRDMMSAFERQADPYIQGAREPAPAVISINSSVTSLAVTMFLSMVSGVPVDARHVLYNAMKSALRHVQATPDSACYICSRSGSFARGNSWPLFARKG